MIFRRVIDLLHTDLFCFNIANDWGLVYIAPFDNTADKSLPRHCELSAIRLANPDQLTMVMLSCWILQPSYTPQNNFILS